MGLGSIPARIFCVHQGGELYGSDRSFLQVVEALRESWPTARIKVVLAVDGPLRSMLERVADEVIVRDLCVLRLANPLVTLAKATIGLPYYLFRAALDVARADFTYINTTVIADYMMAARMAAARSVIHVREIPKAKAMPVVRALVGFSGAALIYNSRATSGAFSFPEGRRQAVIYNGVAGGSNVRLPGLFEAYDSSRPLRIVMLGRISDWKGQDLLIEALSHLSEADKDRVRVRIVGSTFRDNPLPIDALRGDIDRYHLSQTVKLEPFSDNPEAIYRWSDLCVVPSRLPEPFGRVAIEAMAQARPVIAARHGGLGEIVEDGSSGWLVAPNDAEALAQAIKEALASPEIVRDRGIGALRRFGDHFSAESMKAQMRRVLARWIRGL